jgi:hypothetical protein
MSNRTRRRVPLALLAALALSGVPGCYRHVVGARGFGAAEPMKMYEPNSSGEQAAKKRRLPSERRETRRDSSP